MEGLGAHRMWGASPAVDLVQAMADAECGALDLNAVTPQESGKDDERINVLVVGAGDIRHVLATLGSLRRRLKQTGCEKKSVHIFLCDSPIECLARHLLLLEIACDWARPVRQRAHTFLEVYGNALVQQRTSQYISQLGDRLVSLVCDGKGALNRLVDLSHLKFKEADALEKVFKSWGDKVPFDMKALREERLRVMHQQRYDSRDRIADWAFQEGVKPQAPIIHISMFKTWRETGIAFEFGDEAYTISNRSMASYAQGKEGGVTKLRRGFWSDIAVSPYFCFGVSCEQPNQHARDLFKVINKGLATEQQRHNTVHIAVYNLLSYLSEIENNRQYLMREANDVYSGLEQKAPTKPTKKSTENDTMKANTSSKKEEQDKIAFAEEAARNIIDLKDRVKVVPITGDTLSKQKYHGKFDLVWISNHNAHLISDTGFRKCINYQRKPAVLVETARNMVMLKPDVKQQYVDKIDALAKSLSWTRAPQNKGPQDDSKLEYLSFLARQKS